VFTGVLIGTGVAAETLLLAVSGRVLARFRAERALAVAFAVGALRWLLISTTTSEVILLLQAPLHAITFGLYWVAGTMLLRDYAGPRASAAGQGLLAAAVAVGSITGSIYGGALFAQGGGPLLFRWAAASAGAGAALAALHAMVVARSGHQLAGAPAR
jgi:PPP family 3-phenylpropionic acid transporter